VLNTILNYHKKGETSWLHYNRRNNLKVFWLLSLLRNMEKSKETKSLSQEKLTNFWRVVRSPNQTLKIWKIKSNKDWILLTKHHQYTKRFNNKFKVEVVNNNKLHNNNRLHNNRCNKKNVGVKLPLKLLDQFTWVVMKKTNGPLSWNSILNFSKKNKKWKN